MIKQYIFACPQTKLDANNTIGVKSAENDRRYRQAAPTTVGLQTYCLSSTVKSCTFFPIWPCRDLGFGEHPPTTRTATRKTSAGLRYFTARQAAAPASNPKNICFKLYVCRGLREEMPDMRNIYAKRNPENLFTTIKHLRQGKNIKFSDLLKPKFSEKIPITGAHHDIRSAEIKNTVDNKTLKGYARDCPKPDSQPATFGNIYGEEAPRETAPRDFHRSVQPAAVEKTVDGDILTNIALTCENPDARPPEVGKIKKTTGYKNE